MTECPFCKIIKKEVVREILWEDEVFFAILDRKPAAPGHILIIPKQHVDYVFDLNDDLYKGIFERAKILAPSLLAATGMRRIGLAVEGFGVAHTHLHLVPLNHGGELISSRLIVADPLELDEIAEKIKQELKK